MAYAPEGLAEGISVLTAEPVFSDILGLAAHLEADASVGIASPAPWQCRVAKL